MWRRKSSIHTAGSVVPSYDSMFTSLNPSRKSCPITSSVKQRGVRRLYGTSRDVARMELVCGSRPGHGYVCHVQPDGHHRALRPAPVIHRLILSDLLSFPNHVAGHVCIPELLYFCLFGEVVQAGVQLEVPLCPGHVVAGQPYCTLVGQAPAPRHQTVITVCASGNSCLGA